MSWHGFGGEVDNVEWDWRGDTAISRVADKAKKVWIENA
jgi:hypothetical protein